MNIVVTIAIHIITLQPLIYSLAQSFADVSFFRRQIETTVEIESAGHVNVRLILITPVYLDFNIYRRPYTVMTQTTLHIRAVSSKYSMLVHSNYAI